MRSERAVLAGLILFARASAAQRSAMLAAGVTARPAVAPVVFRAARSWSSRDSASPQPAKWLSRFPRSLAPAASAAIPGIGQLVLGQDRVIAYLAVEGFVWSEYARYSHDLARQREAYRNLARAARTPFTAVTPVGPWAYYELVEHNIASGHYSLGPPGQLIPETDTTTVNGAYWLLAQRNYWAANVPPPAPGSPAYQRALAFYDARAIRPEYRWSWRNAQLEWDLYRRTINNNNDAARGMRNTSGVIIANHVLSAIDAFASFRMHVSQLAGGGFRVSAAIPSGALR